MKSKQIMMVTVGTIGMGIFSMQTIAEETGNKTSVSGEIKAGPLTMKTPDDVTFDITLTGADQSHVLADIETTVKDYRGANIGWTLSVQSPNYSEYGSNFTVLIDGKDITDVNEKITEDTSLALEKELTFTTAINVSKEAKQGTYAANLVWTLVPTPQIEE